VLGENVAHLLGVVETECDIGGDTLAKLIDAEAL
jgi:hypothetical protein